MSRRVGESTRETDRTVLDIEHGLDALRSSPEFRGPVEPLEDHDHGHELCDHLALIYESDAQQLAAVTPFMREGIERGERCLFVLDESFRKPVFDALRETDADVESALDSGTLGFHTVRETYLRGGTFDPDRIVEYYDAMLDEALEEYPGIRVTAGTEWVLEEDVPVDDFMEYESRVNELFDERECIALCQYDRRRFPATLLSDIIRTHPHLVYDNTVCHNFYYVPPTEFLGPDRPDREVDRMLHSLLDRTDARMRLNDTVDELTESNRRLKQFAHIASHDLQEPLRMVSSYLQLLEERYGDELDAEAREYIDFAVDGADRMREMVDDLLAYSRIEGSDRTVKPVEFDAVVSETIAGLQYKIDEAAAEIVVGDLPTIPGDARQLGQLFENLISNALKYRAEGRQPRIEIGAVDRGDRWEFTVADNGIGIDAEHTDQIFDVFTRLHSAEDYPGTGIGLALCQKIVRNHGGEIWVESEPGEGSTFSFTVPGRDPVTSS